MGLPAGQQRVLDAIEDALRAGEPRLATMYSIFGRLTRSESRPAREQLPYASGWRSWPARLRHALAPRRLLRSLRHTCQPARGRRRVLVSRLLVLGQLMAVLAVVGLLVGLGSSMTPAACATRLQTGGGVVPSRPASCAGQVSLGT